VQNIVGLFFRDTVYTAAVVSVADADGSCRFVAQGERELAAAAAAAACIAASTKTGVVNSHSCSAATQPGLLICDLRDNSGNSSK